VRRLVRGLAIVAVMCAGVLAVAPARRAVLRGAGHVLVAGDDAQAADLIVTDVESGPAGLLTIGDLHRSQPQAAVGVLVPDTTRIDAELQRRGIVLPNYTLHMLAQLGIPAEAIVRIPAGEGGTSETTRALGEWGRTHPGQRVLVVVGPSHGRRYRRALRRAWPGGSPAPIVMTAPYGLFRAEDWWQSRTTVREGLVELEKLALDYARHPW
jgi:uncharacterized SAM-binding protein YcdF (DUF218 family)